MANNTETGYAKIIANFFELLGYILGFGKEYNPSRKNIKPEEMEATGTRCKNSMETVRISAVTYKNAVAERESAFAPLSKLATRLFNTLKASVEDKRISDIAVSYLRKLQGRRAKAKRTDEEKKADIEAGVEFSEVSSSQMSYDSRIENFDLLIQVAANTASYQPNEPDLQVATLKEYSNTLKAKNAAVTAAKAALFNARKLRNELMNKEITGLVDVAMDAKTYIKGAFGPGSPQFRKVASLAFRRSRN